MRTICLVVMIGICAACAGGRALAATYYVATTGLDTNPGSSEFPWATLQHAVDTIDSGDIILVRSGAYVGCRIGNPGEAGSPKTLAAETGASVVVNAPGPENRHASIIEVENWDLPDGTVRYWIIDGLEVCNSATRYGIDIRTTQYLTVRNCLVHDNQVTGIFDAFSDYNVYEFNESHHNHEHGFYHSNSGDYITLRGNLSHHNDGCGIHMNGDLSMGGDGQISHAVVERNTIWENGAVSGGSGINCDGVSDSIIRNNLLYDNHASGISLYGIDAAAGSSRNQVYNNTILMPSDSRWAVNIPAGDGGKPNPTGNSVVNNILYNTHSWHGVITIWDTSALSVSDYNVVMDRFGYPDDATVIGLSAWQALGYDEHSIIATPAQLFVDTATPDYHLKTGSPAIAAGTVLAEVTDDRDGTARPAGGPYDLGCYQTEGTPADPTADFSASPTSGVKPLSVTFSDLTTGVPTSWQWDFGDGDISDLRNPTHQYQQAGSYTVSLSVANGLGDDVETKADFIKAATFPDVLPDNWAWEQVEGCVANDVVQGYVDGTYQPLGQVARDQMAVYAARAIAGGDAGVPDAGCSSPPFTDVLCDHWARKYIQYAVAQGVVQGYPEGDYKPDLAVTRDQMAVYVARAMVAPTGEAALDDYVPADPRNFPDVPNSGYGDSGTDPFWAYTHIEYCVENGVVAGYGDGYYHPDYVVTRDQMAVYIARAFGLIP